jgi:hypothetical protein
LTGLRHNKVARWQVFVAKSNETPRSKGIKMPAEEPMSELNDGQVKIPKKKHKKTLCCQRVNLKVVRKAGNQEIKKLSVCKIRRKK